MSSSFKRPPPRQVPPPDPVGSPAPSHARFIPKEELSSFSSWTPIPLGERATPAPPPVPIEAESDVPAIDVDALQQAARQSGYHDGYRDGLAALESFKRSFAQQMTAQVAELVRSMESGLDGLDEQMAQALSAAAVGLARQLVRSELTARPEAVVQVARDAVGVITAAARTLELRVHPHDLELVRDGLGEQVERRGILLMADNAIGRGGCRLTSDLGSVDATLESRWAHALQRLGVMPVAQVAGHPQQDDAPGMGD